MTAAQLAVLNLISDRKIEAFCDKCVWQFRDDMGDTINRRTIHTLKTLGLIHIMYVNNRAGVNLTEAGRKRMDQLKSRRSRVR